MGTATVSDHGDDIYYIYIIYIYIIYILYYIYNIYIIYIYTYTICKGKG